MPTIYSHTPTPRRGNFREHFRGRGGYTLVEVLLVVAILGIVSAAVIPSMLTAGSMGVQAAARVIVADLLYAQNEAIAQQAPRAVVFDVANDRYQVNDEFGNALSLDWINGDANNYVVDFTEDARFQGVTITAVDFNGGSEITFDDLGGPSSGGSITIVFDRRSYRIDVAEFTGRITVTKLS
ncbi:MAG: GspH/FimT family pseudopilin [Planctomycetota bacterium]